MIQKMTPTQCFRRAAQAGLALAALGLGCDAEPMDPAAESVEATPFHEDSTTPTAASDAFDSNAESRHTREPISLRVELPSVPAGGRHTLDDTDSIRLEVINDGGNGGLVTVRIGIPDEHGPSRTAVGQVHVDANARASLDIPVTDFPTSRTRSRGTGHISFSAVLHTDDGEGVNSAPLPVAFTSRTDSWTLYGAEANGALFEDTEMSAKVRKKLRDVLDGGAQSITLPDGTQLDADAPEFAPFVTGPARSGRISG